MSLPVAAKRPVEVVFRCVLLLAIFGITCGLPAQTNAHPDNPLAASAYQRGMVAAENGDLTAARSAFEQAVKLNPWNPEFQNALAQMMLRQGDVDGAISHLRTVTQSGAGCGVASRRTGEGPGGQGLA